MTIYKTDEEIMSEDIDRAISHFQYGISHDIFSEPVTSYSKLAVIALEEYKQKICDKTRV